MEEKVIVSSLALDLRRVAQGLHRGSLTSAKVFKQEALKRGQELELKVTNEYLRNLWESTKKSLEESSERTAEDLLMYSTLFQNFAVKKL